MTLPRSLLLASTLFSLTLSSPAELPADARIEHLEQAARHLTEIGMIDHAADLRAEADDIRRDLGHGQIAELAAMVQQLREQNRALQERLTRLEAQAGDDQAKAGDDQAEQPAPDLDQLAAEAHRKQTEETWAAIKRAAREGLPPAPEVAPQPPAPEPPTAVPQAKPTPTKPAPAKKVAPQDRDLLEQILRTLQSIERNMGS